MIITRLTGGLGNQMFQYAVARSLSIIKQTDFKMDVSGFGLFKPTAPPRRYELGHFNIIENFAQKREIHKFTKRPLFYRFVRRIFPFSNNIYPYNTFRYYTEKKWFIYDPHIFELQGNIYLDGYWQSEKYFKNIKDVIKEEFTVKTEPDEENKILLNKIRNCNAVAVHIRRGDYVENPCYFGLSDSDYYKKGVDLIGKRVADPHFFVFSDDIKWTKENLKIGFPTTCVTYNGENKGYEDLRLMSNCKHFIIANSSFSWWGAWLSESKNKIVIAPKKWYKEKDKKEWIDTKDLIPEGWIRI